MRGCRDAKTLSPSLFPNRECVLRDSIGPSLALTFEQSRRGLNSSGPVPNGPRSESSVATGGPPVLQPVYRPGCVLLDCLHYRRSRNNFMTCTS